MHVNNKHSLTPSQLSAEQIVAYMLDWDRRSRVKADELERSRMIRSQHTDELYVLKKAPAPFRNRDFHVRRVWKKLEEGTCIISTTPIYQNDFPPDVKAVRGRFPLAMKIVAISPTECKVEYTIQIDFGGIVPAKLTNMYIGRSLASGTTEVQEFFQSLRPLADWDSKDGRAVGVVVCIKTEAEKREKQLKEQVKVRMVGLFGRYRGLKEAGERYVRFQTMLAAAAQNSLQLGGDVGKGLGELSVEDGEKIGKALASALAGTRMGPKKAVDAWIRRFPALVQLDEEEAWFRPMAEAMAKKLVSEVGWGAKRRLCVGERSEASAQQLPIPVV